MPYAYVVTATVAGARQEMVGDVADEISEASLVELIAACLAHQAGVPKDQVTVLSASVMEVTA